MSVENLTQQWRSNALRLNIRACAHELKTGATYTWTDMLNLVGNYRTQLRAAGLGRGQRLALLEDASVQWIAMVWACWEEGVCWSPFPSTVPMERRNLQLQFGEFHAQWDGNSIVVRNANAALNSCDAAYLIFTSGTTGEPKGVLVGWQGLENLWREQCSVFELTEDSTSVWMLSPSFDASVSDIGVALYAGAQLVVVPHKHWLHYKRWKSDMETFGVTHLDAPPSLLALWERKTIPQSLKVVIAGGEPTSPSLLQAWSQKVRWVNVYGPTETTVCSSAEVRTVKDLSEGLPTLGQPLMGIVYKVVHPTQTDSNEGELWIGGDCVALEYWRNPHLTEEKFISDGIRWFKTGDWVRQVDDAWVYCGRLDRQVKRNGQLINLDEIEHTLSECDGVGQVVVVIKNDILYAAHCSNCDADFLHSFAQQRLPSWGVPKFVQRDQWPLNMHNKIDRTQLEKEL